MMILPIFLLIISLCIVLIGAKFLVSGATSIGKILKLPDIVIGLTIIGFGTSSPEFFINLFGNLSSHSDISVGNIIGSNMINTTWILGISALFTPIIIKKEIIYKEYVYSFLTLITLFVSYLIFGHQITRFVGVIFILIFGGYLFHIYYLSKNHVHIKSKAKEVKPKNLTKSILLTFIGISLLGLGGHLIIQYTVELAKLFSISETFISIIFVSIGTTIPETMTAIISSFKKKPELITGNAIGTIAFNTLFILGFSSLIKPISLTINNLYDFLILAIALIVLYITMIVGKRYQINFNEGLILIAFYIIYLIYLVFREGFL